MEIPDKGLEHISKNKPVDRLRPAPSKTGGSAGGEGNASDAVSIANEGRFLAALQAAVGESPELRTQRIEELRRQINNGEYPVDLAALARNLLNQE